MSSSLPPPSTIVVSSFVTTTLRADPSRSMVVFSSFSPTSSEMTCPPVRIAMSWSMALRRSPKPGALTAALGNVPRMRLTTSVARASPSTSSAITSSGLPACMTFSRRGRRSWTPALSRQRQRLGPRRDAPRAFRLATRRVHLLGRHTVARAVVGHLSDLLVQLRAYLLHEVVKLDLLGERDAGARNHTRPPPLLKD